MSDVTLSVAGRKYTVSCAEGDEDRVRTLAQMIGDRLAGIGASLNNPMEAHNLLIAGLILADELEEAQKSSPSAAPMARAAPAVADALESLASRLENAAEALEQRDASA
ncbi:cell division protein ZapA [Qipengyuania sp. MTN3-11]|uniref:cell division protein ZapA n=1 Tax=Qipengyuania sp. MTN3-11 TaxID=3056557 RepID=UPI0036F1B859